MPKNYHERPRPPAQYPPSGYVPPVHYQPQPPPVQYPPQGDVHYPPPVPPSGFVPADGPKKRPFWRRARVIVAATTALAGAGGGVWAAYEAHSANSHPRSTAKITSWTGRDCQGVGQRDGTELEGTAELLPGETLWEITIPGENPVAFVGGPIEVGNDGRWRKAVGPIGGDQDRGKKFELMIVAAPPSLQRTLRDAFENGQPISPAPTVTDHPLAQICAIRTD